MKSNVNSGTVSKQKTEWSANDVLETIRAVLPRRDKPIGLHEPTLKGNEWQYVKECLDTGWVSYLGKFVDQFERTLEEFTSSKHAIAMVNGTCALQIALILAGVEAGDEVLVPDLTFVGTANSVAHTGAIPHFVEVNATDLSIDVPKLDEYLSSTTTKHGPDLINKNTGRRISALIIMHCFGHPGDLDATKALCEKYGITLVEDAAEALGSTYKGKHVGTHGKLSILSFNGNKTITTGGGGAVLTDDPALAKRAKHMTATAKIPHQWEFNHDEVGYNYRMTNVNAAIGCAQMEQLQDFLQQKRALFAKYEKFLAEYDGIQLLKEPANCRSNYWLVAMVLDEDYSHLRNEILSVTNSSGIMTRPIWNLMHTLPMYADAPRMSDLSVSESLAKRVICLPSSSSLFSA